MVDNGDNTAELRLYKDEEMVQVIPLEDVKDVRDVASKTHAHAFEVVGGNDRAIIILSGETALESRDWIWSIQKIFRPVDQDGIQGTIHAPVQLPFLGGVRGLDPQYVPISVSAHRS